MTAHADSGCVAGFFDQEGRVVLARVGSSWELGASRALPSPVLPHDAPTCISLGQDAAGRVHAIFGAHASRAWHLTTNSALNSDLEVNPLGEAEGDRFTYPTLISNNSAHDLVLLYRQGSPWSGEIRLRRWNDAGQVFDEDHEALISGTQCKPTAGPYINRPVFLPDGSMACFYVWRLSPVATSAGDVANTGLDLLFLDEDLRGIRTQDGVELQRPVTPVHTARIFAVPPGANLMNQGAAAAGPGGSPIAVTYWNDKFDIPQYHIVWREDSKWRAGPISAFRTRFSLRGRGTLPLPHSRPELIVRPDGVVLCFFRSSEFGNRLMLTIAAPCYDDRAQQLTVILVDRDLGHYEPVLDHAAYLRSGELVLYVQWCEQGNGDSEVPPKAASAHLLRWSADQVSNWQPAARRFRFGMPFSRVAH